MIRSVMVTGAGGYIGSVLTRNLLSADYRVTAVDRFFFGRETLPSSKHNLHIVKNDIRWMDDHHFQDVDAVIDLAALSNDPTGELAPDKTWQVNCEGRIRVARTAKKHGVKRYVFPSSCSVYGFQDAVIDETSPTKPLTTYAQANLEAERQVLAQSDDDFCVVVLRQATVYGLSPRMRFDLAINGMVRGLFKEGKVPILRDGTQWRPFVHVSDTTSALASALDVSARLVNKQIINVGSDEQNCQIRPLAEAVAEAAGLPFDFEWYGLPDHRSYRVSFAKAKKLLGFKADKTPDDGAREIFEQLSSNSIDPDDPKTITVQWYKHLIDMHELLKEIEVGGVLL